MLSALRFHKLTLTSKLTLGVLFLLALTTIAQVHFTRLSQQELTLNALHERVIAISTFKATELQNDINRLRRDVQFLAQLPSTQKILQTDRTIVESLKEQLSDSFLAFQNANPSYYQIRLIGIADSGREIIRVNYINNASQVTPSTQLQQKASRDYFVATTKLNQNEIYLSEINLNQERGVIEQPFRPTLRAVTPLLTTTEKNGHEKL